MGPTSGYMVEAWGWAPFYLGTVVAAVPGVALLWAMRGTVHRYEAQAREPAKEPGVPRPA
ncbi:muropeptide transporter [compost metagenome]